MRQGVSASDIIDRNNKRTLFADYIRQQEAARLGLRQPVRLQTGNDATKPYSTYQLFVDGAQYTTAAELNEYISDVQALLPQSDASASSILPPDAPTGVSAVAGNGEATVSFTPPVSNGGAPITSYTVVSDPEGLTATGATSPITITGLANGQTYTFNVFATNSAGNSALSAASDPVSLTGGTLTTTQFTSVGTIAWLSPSVRTIVEYLVVGGGGGSGGGFDTGGGGGGGGGMVLTGTISTSADATYTVIVGDGGAGGISIRSPVSETNGSEGESSQFDTVIANGGGGGYASRQNAGISSAGGIAAVANVSASTGGSGGGSAGDLNGAGGGGGGSSGNGSAGVSNTGGNGGAGTVSSLSGAAVTYGAGGPGANGNTNVSNGGVAGTANTGNGARGGGTASSSQTNGAKGGSGIVIIRYYTQP